MVSPDPINRDPFTVQNFGFAFLLVFFNRPHFRFLESGYRPREDVYGVLGQTNGGRYLIVFFIYKPDRLELILSARDMDEKERRRYERR